MSTWIKSDERLANHPKVDLLAATLDIHPAQALGHLHYVWYFGLNYADDGDLTHSSWTRIACRRSCGPSNRF